MSEWWYLSSERMTVAVRVDNGTIMETPYIVRKFKYQPLNNLARWMKQQGDFKITKMRGRPQE